MPSFQISITRDKRAAGRFIAAVRRELQKALAEEHASRGITQSAIAEALDVNRSVIHRQIVGYENLTLGRVAEIAEVLRREVIFKLEKLEEGGNLFSGEPHQAQPVQLRQQPTQSSDTPSVHDFCPNRWASAT